MLVEVTRDKNKDMDEEVYQIDDEKTGGHIIIWWVVSTWMKKEGVRWVTPK